MTKEQLPTIQIKGKSYVLVKDRVLAFHERHPAGMIQTTLLTPWNATTVIFKAEVWPDAKDLTRFFTGHSQAEVGGSGVNLASALENSETSSIGRALAALGIGIIDSIASADELYKSDQQPKTRSPGVTPKSIAAKPKNLKACDKCGKDMALRNSAKGQFYGCMGYPTCKRTMTIEDATMWEAPPEPIPPKYNDNEFPLD